MSNQIKLAARPRAEHGRNAVKQLRARGSVPAIIYGNRQEPQNLEINRREIEMLLAHAAGENLLVELEVQADGTSTNRLSLIQEVQHDPIKGTILHVDFQAVSATETIEAEIPLEPVGEAAGVKNFGGVLQQNMHNLLVSCLPQNLPQLVHVDVSHLGVGEAVHVRDIVLPEGVSAAVDSELTAFIVTEPRVEVEPVVAEVAAAPEVLKEKKADGEEKK